MLSRTVAGDEKKSNFCLAGLMLASAGFTLAAMELNITFWDRLCGCNSP